MYIYIILILRYTYYNSNNNIIAYNNILIIYHLLTESEVITGKSQTEALMY